MDAETGNEETLKIDNGESVNIIPEEGKYNGVAGNSVVSVKEDKKIENAQAPNGKEFIGWKAEKRRMALLML